MGDSSVNFKALEQSHLCKICVMGVFAGIKMLVMQGIGVTPSLKVS